MSEKIAVYGTGRIGTCEATIISGNGFRVTVIGHSEEGLERCRKDMERNWDDLIKEGLATEKNKKAAMELVTVTRDISALTGSTFVFEAVAENTEIKRSVYKNIEKYCGDDTVIASCTSSIDLKILADMVNRPERMIIAHPFQPAHMLPLVEVVCHEKLSKDTLDRTTELLKRLGREVVVLKKSVPGFLINRFAHALFREAIYLMEEDVVCAEDVDRAIKYAMGMRYASIGLLEYYDDVGFELESAVASNIYPDLCNTAGIQRTTIDGLKTGKTGRESGTGLFDWSRKDIDDYRYRKQAPYFAGVKNWTMPE